MTVGLLIFGFLYLSYRFIPSPSGSTLIGTGFTSQSATVSIANQTHSGTVHDAANGQDSSWQSWWDSLLPSLSARGTDSAKGTLVGDANQPLTSPSGSSSSSIGESRREDSKESSEERRLSSAAMFWFLESIFVLVFVIVVWLLRRKDTQYIRSLQRRVSTGFTQGQSRRDGTPGPDL